MFDRVWPVGLLVAASTLVVSTNRAWSQVVPGGVAERDRPETMVVVGTIGRLSSNLTTPSYVLLDESGTPVASLVGKHGLALYKFVGRLAAVTARPSTQQGAVRQLLVHQVTPLDRDAGQFDELTANHRYEQRGAVMPVSFDSPVVVETPPTVVVEPPPAVVVEAAPDGFLNPTARRPGCDAYVPYWCGPPGRFWAEARYLLWRTEGASIPPLVTTSPQGTPEDIAGVLGQPGTTILFGNDDILTDVRHGVRLSSGIWIDRQGRFGIQSEIFGLSKENTNFFATSVDGNPILARPFFNMNPRVPTDESAFDPPPREAAQELDTVWVDAGTELYSLGAVARVKLACVPIGCFDYSRVDLLSGYRYMRLEESLQIREAVMGEFPPDTTVEFDIFDRFNTRNDFHGADVGTVWELTWRRLSFELLTKMAIGNIHQTVDIQGGTVITTNGVPASYVGGLLAQSTNIGHYTRDRFGVIPELGLTFGYRIRPRWKLTAGYTLLYWSRVVRPGEQIDRDVNPDLLPPPIEPLEGPLRPEFVFHDVNLWAQGLHFGVEGRW